MLIDEQQQHSGREGGYYGCGGFLFFNQCGPAAVCLWFYIWVCGAAMLCELKKFIISAETTACMKWTNPKSLPWDTKDRLRTCVSSHVLAATFAHTHTRTLSWDNSFYDCHHINITPSNAHNLPKLIWMTPNPLSLSFPLNDLTMLAQSVNEDKTLEKHFQ